MLKRLSLDSSRHPSYVLSSSRRLRYCYLISPSPPYLTFGDAWDDQGRQFVRMLRKKIGLPASADVGYLASMIKSLRRAAEERLQIPIFKAGITSPHLVALYTEDLRDACEYMGFTYLSFPTRYQLLYETTAIYAGYGYGLCDDFTRKENCKKEQKDMDFDTVVSILFTPTALTVAFSAMKSAYYLSEYDNRRLADFELGYNSRLRQYNENRYWMLVEEQLTAIINIEPYSDPPSKVLLVGEHIDHPSFRNALTKALGDRMNSSLILDSDAKFIAAKGAAELARRLPWDPYES